MKGWSGGFGSLMRDCWGLGRRIDIVKMNARINAFRYHINLFIAIICCICYDICYIDFIIIILMYSSVGLCVWMGNLATFLLFIRHSCLHYILSQ